MDMPTIRVSGLIAILALGIGWPSVSADTPGSMRVESDPAGASVYVDGRLAGETPVTVPELAAGIHRVRVVRLGYLENSRLVTVKAGAHATLRMRLTDPAPQAAKAAALKIVVLEGEGAVNIIQQKTAVAPVIEVRDRNDQPVAGAVVRFAIQKGRATFNGARTLSVTTDAAGRATATGLAATSRGAVQITVSAAFQGQTAAATIAQTAVMTTAEASSIAAGTGSVSAGGGGGLSHTALAGIIGGAGAGIAGAVIASKKLSAGSRTFTGPFTGQNVVTRTTTGGGIIGTNTCVSTQSITGMLTIQLEERDDGTVAGNGSTTGTRTQIAVTCNAAPLSVSFNFGGPVSGTVGNITLAVESVSARTTPEQTVDSTLTLGFTGSLNSGVITGTLSFTETFRDLSSSGSIGTGSGSTTFAVTLR